MTLPEMQEELFRQSYPQLTAEEDPDIERYYALRSSGQAPAALYIFQTRLKPRYPDDQFRTVLMRCYRNRDPLYKRLLAFAYRQLARESLDRVKAAIAAVARRAESYDPGDVYATIRTAEDILALLPRGRYEAVEGAEKLLRYAQVLDYYAGPLEKAAALIRSYLGQSLEPVNQEIRRRENLRREAAEREGHYGREGSPALRIDLSAVVFSPRDLARIEIPPALTRLEDRTLAYCAKYWNLIGDPVFDRTLFLYSRKYGVKNYEVFQLIRRGIEGSHRDDEILASVMSALATGYYYSIRGDHYLQQQWNSLKARICPPEPAPGPGTAPAMPPVMGSPAGGPSPAGAGRIRKKRQRRGEPGRQVKKAAKKRPRRKAARGEPALRPRRRGPYRSFPEAAQVRDGSVAGRLKKLSGRSYDLYQDRFLAQTRTAIRKVMGTGKGIFFSLPERAEDLIYQFLRDHYADPYMNWEESEARKALALMGYQLESLEQVIDECYARL